MILDTEYWIIITMNDNIINNNVININTSNSVDTREMNRLMKSID